jgi:hypothetical protein
MLRRYADRMMLLPRGEARELEAEGGIVAQLAKRAPQREKLLRRDHASARAPQCERQSALAKEHSRIDARSAQAGLQGAVEKALLADPTDYRLSAFDSEFRTPYTDNKVTESLAIL